ncbi:MFS transporter [Lipingzhangella sp. LS1_29]|uniref:MFS transporter n=1 Tax=Lipingzhangella rawalii TaxID=2055835 RepID=A0ABU2HAE3_9ACTN|nr:MFS transporter [Lipingzhangella rawalii]MDS1271564.1 MFS transporter [Lipingzhangella rawalii]
MDEIPSGRPNESHSENEQEHSDTDGEAESPRQPVEEPAEEGSAGTAPPTDWRSGYRLVMSVREFQALWLSHVLSMTGTSLLSIAVTVLVYQQTNSAVASGITLAMTFLPQAVGGVLLAGLADIFPRRQIIIASDLIRGILVLAIGWPGLPVWAIWTLLFFVILPTMPFAAARAALMADIVQGERYVAGSAIINLTTQAGQIGGLLLGGAVLTLIGPNSTMLLNGIAFALAALIVWAGVRFRPSTLADNEDNSRYWGITLEGFRMVAVDYRLRTLTLLAWLAGCYAVPLALANPLADELGGDAGTVSLIMGAVPVGALVGGLVLTRLVNPALRMRLLLPLAVLTSAPLLGFAADPPLWILLGLLAVSGMCGSYQFVANAAFVLCTPEQSRGRAFGLVASGLQAVQGLGMLLGSLLLAVTSTQLTVALAGACGVVLALLLTRPWHRVMPGVLEQVRTP